MRVLVFGSSIAQGFWDIEHGGWIARVRKYFDTQQQKTGEDKATLFNLGISGDSSDGVLQRIEHEVMARKNDEGLGIVIAIGLNDSRIKPSGNYTEPDQYRNNLEEILKIAQKHTNKILCIGLTPCVDEQTHPVSWNDTVYDNTRIKLFDKTMKDFCDRRELPFVDMLPAFSADQAKRNLFSDGLHPNEEGHQFMADVILPYIEEMVS